MKKHISLLAIFILFTLIFTSCGSSTNNSTGNGTTNSTSKTADPNQKYEHSEIVMDTPVTLRAYGPNAQKAVDDGFTRLKELDAMASSDIATSDVSKINAAAGKSYVKVHPEIMKMVETSIQYSKLSGGAWDITMGPLIDLWGIGTDNQRLPSDAEIKERMPLIGYDKISVNDKDSSIMLQKPGMAIDLGGIAKGFAADEVEKIYKKYNIQNGLINLGSSSIYALGKNESGNQWAIGIKHPRSDVSGNYLGIIRISNEALSTSGDYEKYFIQNGIRYCHILDPVTGSPARNGVISDTIIIDGNSPDRNMLADLLTTTVFVLGPEKGLKFIDSLKDIAGVSGVSCEVTTPDLKVYQSSSFKGRLSNLGKDFKLAN